MNEISVETYLARLEEQPSEFHISIVTNDLRTLLSSIQLAEFLIEVEGRDAESENRPLNAVYEQVQVIKKLREDMTSILNAYSMYDKLQRNKGLS